MQNLLPIDVMELVKVSPEFLSQVAHANFYADFGKFSIENLQDEFVVTWYESLRFFK